MLITFFVKAQGNLQFNRVLTYSGTLYGGTSSDTWTVPTGKVWKIESLPNPGSELYAGTPSFSLNFLLNGTSIINYYALKPIIMPIWLKASDNIKFSYSGNYSTAVNYYISIIEFNVNQ